jgi:hypothetical protein
LLDEYALRFYTFIEQSIKLDAREWLETASAISMPNMDEGERTRLFTEYQEASRDIIEDIRASMKPDIETLREELNG